MNEEIIRSTISKLWRNHPDGAATFSECSSEGCNKPARDGLCDWCLIFSLECEEYNKFDLLKMASMIGDFRRLEAKIVDREEG